MSWRDAPLYVEAHDLTRWVLERCTTWHERACAAFTAETVTAACNLVAEISLALTFPATRSRHLAAADENVVRVRTLLRLALELGLISPGGLRHASGRLLAIGRMIGGWRKRIGDNDSGAARPDLGDQSLGDGLPTASSG